jgi:hypothetical protein
MANLVTMSYKLLKEREKEEKRLFDGQDMSDPANLAVKEQYMASFKQRQLKQAKEVFRLSLDLQQMFDNIRKEKGISKKKL